MTRRTYTKGGEGLEVGETYRFYYERTWRSSDEAEVVVGEVKDLDYHGAVRVAALEKEKGVHHESGNRYLDRDRIIKYRREPRNRRQREEQ